MDLCECGRNCKRKKCRLKKRSWANWKKTRWIGKRLDGQTRQKVENQFIRKTAELLLEDIKETKI